MQKNAYCLFMETNNAAQPTKSVLPFVVKTDKVSVECDGVDFVIRCLRDEDSLPTGIPLGKPQIKKFCKFFASFDLTGKSFHEVVRAAREAGIRVHSYCAMD